MPHYQVMCITTKHAAPRRLVQLFQKVHDTVHLGGGVFRRVDNLGVRPLAYRMKAHQKFNYEGRYVRFFLQTSPQNLVDVEKRLRVDDEVIRFMTLREKYIAPAADDGVVRPGEIEMSPEEPDAILRRAVEHVPHPLAAQSSSSSHLSTDTSASSTTFDSLSSSSSSDIASLGTDALAHARDHRTLDYFVARTLLEHNLITKEELQQLTADASTSSTSNTSNTNSNATTSSSSSSSPTISRASAELAPKLRAIVIPDELRSERERVEGDEIVRYHEKRRQEVEQSAARRKEWLDEQNVKAKERLLALRQQWIESRVQKDLKRYRLEKQRSGVKLTDAELETKRAELLKSITTRKAKQEVRALDEVAAQKQ